MLAACDAPSDAASARCAAVVYGDDTRRELYEIEQPTLQERAARSVVALVATRDVLGGSDVDALQKAETAGEAYTLCDGQPFAQQPSLAYCSGTLIAPDLVLTAGHCFSSLDTCRFVSAVFGYHLDGPDALGPIAPDDVYACAELLAFEPPDREAERVTDFALMRLDRPVEGAQHVAPIAAAPLSHEGRYALMGHGLGLPLKVDPELYVRDLREAAGDYFTASVDAFVGDSGAGVFDERGRLIGMLLSGQPDFVLTEQGCQVVRRRDVGCAAGRGAERVAYPHAALAALCDLDATFCGVAR